MIKAVLAAANFEFWVMKKLSSIQLKRWESGLNGDQQIAHGIYFGIKAWL